MLLPVEAEGGQLLHVAAVDLAQGVGPQGAALYQIFLPARGAPRLQLFLNIAQDLLIMRRGDLSAITPIHLQRAVQRPRALRDISTFKDEKK